MARFLITSWPSNRHLSPLLAVAGTLQRRGHQVGIYTGSHLLAGIPQGLDHFPFNHVNEEVFTRVVSADGGVAPLHRPLELRNRLRSWLIDSIPDQLRDLDPILAKWRPDAVICDYSMWGPMLVLQETQPIPVAAFAILMTCQLPGPQAAPGFGLPRRLRGRQWLRARVLRAIRETVFTRPFRHGANAVRRMYALPAIRESVVAYTGRMPLYLIPSIPELDGNRSDLPSTVHYIGPCATPPPLDPSAAAGNPSPAPDMVIALESNPGRQTTVLRAAIQGLSQVSVQLGLELDDPDRINALGPLPASVLAYVSASRSEQLHRPKVVLASARADRIFDTLAQGVPMVLVSWGEDEPENAQRVADAGAGLRVNGSDCTPDALRQAVMRILNEPSFQAQAVHIARSIARHDSANHAADLVEQLAAAPGHGRISEASL